ncbi:hypothetical protein SVAN01_11777 [Stagonosporopsis vannaccii]|nr:hypothetical protein SVAN01_11777 [Stagonosporopsis vannaccii]
MDTKVPSRIDRYTTIPIIEEPTFPFLAHSAQDVIQWAESNIDRWKHGITPYELVVFDERTLMDRTCLLVTVKEGGHVGSQAVLERLMVRSDFRSSLVTLNVKVQACEGDGHFEALAADGILRHCD